MARRDHNLRQVEKFLSNFDRLFPSSVGFLNLEEVTDKPGSTPPIPDRAWDYIMDQHNKKASIYLWPILEELKRERPPLWYIAGVVAGWVKPMIEDEEPDHGRLMRWKARQTEKDKAGIELFQRACKWIEERLNHKHPKLEIVVNIPHRDNPLEGLIHQRNVDNNALRSWDARESYRRIDAEIKEIIQVEGCTVEAAIGLYRDRLEKANEPNVCVRKIWMARAFVKEEEEIKAIVKEKNCSWEFAIDLYELRKQGQRGGAA